MYRGYGCRVDDNFTYKGLRILILENEFLRMTIAVDKGTDILELTYKPRDLQILWQSPLRISHPATMIGTSSNPSGNFLDHYYGGWQEIFPSGGARCTYNGADLGMHGEVSLMAWNYKIEEDSPEQVTVSFSVKTLRTPFVLTKRITLKRGLPVIACTESVLNEGQEEISFMWGQHPVFGAPFLDSSCRLDLPGGIVFAPPEEVWPSGKVKGEKEYQWPIVTTRDGKTLDLTTISGPKEKSTELLFIKNLKAPWYALCNKSKQLGVGMIWDQKAWPNLWIWRAFGGSSGYPWYGREYCLGIEPWSSYPDQGVTKAIENGTARKLKPGDRFNSWFNFTIFEGVVDRVTEIKPDGSVVIA